jgi:tetratricopeptide (TPR) repeat protein
MYRKIGFTFAALVGLSLGAYADTASIDEALATIGHRWAKISYSTPEAQRSAAFESLIASAQQLAQANPGKADPLIWEAIVLASAAKVEGGLGALRKAKEARDLLIAAEGINPNALDGSIYGSLGSLYAKVPGWPIGFGDKKKAREYLEKAIAIDPNNIDSNYFYADFLADQGEYAQSAEHLQRALAAPPRNGREDADAGRREQANALLATLRQKHGDQLATN